MALMRLPSELLLLILESLGPKFFREDVGRLTISKKWLDLAWGVYARDLQLTESSLGKFIENVTVIARCQPYIVTVQLYLKVSECPNPSSSTDSPQPASGSADQCASHLGSSLTNLAATLQQCPGMRCLEVEARAAGLQRQPFRMAKPLADLLSLRYLTSLRFDTAGCRLNQGQAAGVHLCCSINNLLPSLRRLRCRMETICERLLDLPAGDTPLALEEVVINLSLNTYGKNLSYRWAKLCQTSIGRSFLGMKHIMETRATALASRSRRPRMVRIISHDFVSLDPYAFDAIRGKRSKLKDTAEWDADGEDDVETEDDDD